jgi:hypothetical protein
MNALPDNSSVNRNRGNNRRKTVFSMQSVPSKSTDIYRKSVARQRSGKHTSTIMGDGVFRGSVQRSSLKNKRRYSDRVLSSRKIATGGS